MVVCDISFEIERRCFTLNINGCTTTVELWQMFDNEGMKVCDFTLLAEAD